MNLGDIAVFNKVKDFAAGSEIKKNIEEKQKEKQKIFGYLGMELYEKCKEGDYNLPDFEIHIEKLKSLDTEIEALNNELNAMNSDISLICSNCGAELQENAKFCMICGTPVASSENICSCGTKLDKGMMFCPVCGQKASEVFEVKQSTDNDNIPQNMRTCICGAALKEGQSICMNCGRLVK